MSAEVSSQPSPPELKSIDRVTSIPIVHDGLSAIHSTLTTYTPTVYAYGQAITTSAYSLSAPIQVRLAPYIVGADGYALKGLDAAQAKFPTPFSIKTEEVVEGIKTRKDSAVSAVTRPVYGLATGVDARLSPIVDRIEGAVHKYGPESTPTDETGTQVGRLYSLSLGLGNHVYNLSAEQLKSLQTQNTYIQGATERLHNLNTNLTASYGVAKGKSVDLVNETRSQAHVYTDHILAEIEKVQVATMDLPNQVQARLAPVQEGIQSSITEITGILKSDAPPGEKFQKVGASVQGKVQPLLAQTLQTIQAYIAEAKGYVISTKEKTEAHADEAKEAVQQEAEKVQHQADEATS